jgi:hypothetical protein
MNTVEKQKEIERDEAIKYLAEILVDAFLKKKARENPKFIYPRPIDPIKELVKRSKERNKLDKKKF